jgi:hypothetical protein
VERLIQVHQTTRAPAIAQVIDSARAAANARAASGANQIPENLPGEKSVAEDFRRLRELSERGYYYDDDTGQFRVMSAADWERRRRIRFAREMRGISPDPPAKYPITRAALNSAWLEHVQNNPGAPVKKNPLLEELPF